MPERLLDRDWQRAYARAEAAGLLDVYCALREAMSVAMTELRALPVGSPLAADALDAVAQLKQDELRFHREVREILDRKKKRAKVAS